MELRREGFGEGEPAEDTAVEAEGDTVDSFTQPNSTK